MRLLFNGSAGTSFAPIGLPSEEKRGLAKDLLLLFEHSHLTSEPEKLSALWTGEPFSEPFVHYSTGVDTNWRPTTGCPAGSPDTDAPPPA